jgi:hypothetical protein
MRRNSSFLEVERNPHQPLMSVLLDDAESMTKLRASSAVFTACHHVQKIHCGKLSARRSLKLI